MHNYCLEDFGFAVKREKFDTKCHKGFCLVPGPAPSGKCTLLGLILEPFLGSPTTGFSVPGAMSTEIPLMG